jgi:hypothetical protein
MDRGEFLQRLHLPKSEHRPLSSSEGQMAVLSAVVQPSPYFPAVEIAELAHGGRI